MCFLRAVAGYKLLKKKHNEDIRQELHVPSLSKIIKYQEKWYTIWKEPRKPKFQG
jgi:hypothetical protein